MPLAVWLFFYFREGLHMNQRRLFKIACLFFLCAAVLTSPAAASSQTYFSYSLDPASAAQEEMVRLNVTAYKTETTAAGFRLRVYYDEDSLEYISTETSSTVKSGTMQTNCSSGYLNCVYVCNPEKGYAPKLSGTVASFLFQIKSNAHPGNTALTVTADQICDYEGNLLDANNTEKKLILKIPEPLSSEARLTELTPSAGTLIPDFSPSVFNYTLVVSSEINAVNFKTAAADGGTVQISRSTLNGAGKETPITVTVTSEDQTQTAKYMITVQRERTEETTDSSAAQAKKADDSQPKYIQEAEDAKKTSSNHSSRTFENNDNEQATRPTAVNHAQVSLAQSSAAEQTGQNQPQQNTDNTLVVIGDRMPSFFTGMLAAALCITVGIAVSLWFPIRLRKP
jgi:hypothetical protein